MVNPGCGKVSHLPKVCHNVAESEFALMVLWPWSVETAVCLAVTFFGSVRTGREEGCWYPSSCVRVPSNGWGRGEGDGGCREKGREQIPWWTSRQILASWRRQPRRGADGPGEDARIPGWRAQWSPKISRWEGRESKVKMWDPVVKDFRCENL